MYGNYYNPYMISSEETLKPTGGALGATAGATTGLTAEPTERPYTGPIGPYAGVAAEPMYEINPQVQQNIMAAMSGNVPSAAAAQQALGLERAQRAALSQAASMRGINPALALRGALATQAQMQQRGLQEAAALRAQEMARARGEALGLEQARAGLYGQREQMLFAEEEARKQRELDLQLARMQQQTAQEAQRKSFWGQVTGGLMGGLAAATPFLFSDKNLKQNIQEADKETYDFLDSLAAKKYQYKDNLPNAIAQAVPAPSQTVFGVIAQDAMKSKMGKSIVGQKEGYNGFEPTQSLGALLASVSALHKRIKALEANKASETNKERK
jgi:hypothetical protein